MGDLAVQVIDTVQTVANGYWALVEGLEQLKVAEESLALARELHEMNRIQIEVGTLAPLELVQSEGRDRDPRGGDHPGPGADRGRGPTSCGAC